MVASRRTACNQASVSHVNDLPPWRCLSAGGLGGQTRTAWCARGVWAISAQEASLSFPRAQGLGVVEGCSSRNACRLRRKTVAKGSRLDPGHFGYDYHARLVTSRMASVAIGRQGRQRLPARGRFSEGRLVPVLLIGVNKTRKVHGFIALPRHLLSTAALQETIRDPAESVGRWSAGHVG